MTPHDSFEDDSPVAPEHVQDEISSLLRRAAAEDSSGSKMPADVALKIREALDAERHSVSRETATPERQGTVVPLPTRGSASRPAGSGHQSAPARTPEVPAAAPPANGDQHVSEAERTQSAPVAEPTTGRGGASPSGAHVPSLENHRRKRRLMVRGASLAAAAAAVAVVGGGILMNNSSDKSSTPVAANDDAVRFTQTNTDYTEASFDTQAAKLSNDTIPQMDGQALAAQHVDLAASKGEVNACINQFRDRLTAELVNRPDKITADFGSFEGKPAIILLLEKNGKKQSFAITRSALSNSCPAKSDILHSGALQS